jgi:hypothetical protein
VAHALRNRSWVRDITGSLTVSVISEYLRIWDILQHVHLDPNSWDSFLWKWSASHDYSASSAYKAFFIGRSELQGSRNLWRIRAPQKCIFFAWTVLHKRCWTLARLLRHGLTDSDSCSFCDQAVESIDHLLLRCPYIKKKTRVSMLNTYVGFSLIFSKAHN